MAAAAPRRSRVRRVLLGLGVAAGGVLLLEGGANVGILMHDVAVLAEQPLAERRHTRHDPELGWSNTPGVVVRDLYSPGASVTIDDDGFRAASDGGGRTRDGAVHGA